MVIPAVDTIDLPGSQLLEALVTYSINFVTYIEKCDLGHSKRLNWTQVGSAKGCLIQSYGLLQCVNCNHFVK